MTDLPYKSETETLDAEARMTLPGNFIELSNGFTHFELAGPPDKRPVVLVHGFSVPSFVWDPTFEGLVKAGYRVLRYDLFGRGYSDRPELNYNIDLFDKQLGDLLAALKIEDAVDLFGLSMGGPIAANFTARHPQQVRKLGLVDPAGFPMKSDAGVFLLKIPLLGESMMNKYGEQMLVAGLMDDFRHPENHPDYTAKYVEQLKYRGFKQAILSTIRNNVTSGSAQAYRQVGQQDRDILLIWGQEDRIIPFSVCEKIRAALPQAEFHLIEDAGHIPHYEKPEVVNPLIIKFLEK
jgi:pimeloyl-ACP methyl ester carboxylesterase